MNFLKTVVLMTAAISADPTELADVPPELRWHNWGPSCAHASVCTALEWHNQPELADWWRRRYYGGETMGPTNRSNGLLAKLTEAKIPFDYTDTADMDFLDRAIANRLCVILLHVPNGHCVNLVDLDDKYATIIDNRFEWQYVKITREQLWREWNFNFSENPAHRNSSGKAIAICLPPPPPWPDLTPRD